MFEIIIAGFIILLIWSLFKFKKYLEGYTRDIKDRVHAQSLESIRYDNKMLVAAHKERMARLKKASRSDIVRSVNKSLSVDFETKD